jgi:hypothetical protein
MYRPSIHLFNGSVADAEIIIQHFGNGKNFLVCIPIKVNDGSGPSNLFFKQIMPFIPVTKNKKQVINVNKWSLNQILNYGSPYYYYLGSFPYQPCNGTNYIIVFDIKHSAKINAEHFKMLISHINSISKSKETLQKEILMYNENGATNKKGGSTEYDIVNCIPITGILGGETPEPFLQQLREID